MGNKTAPLLALRGGRYIKTRRYSLLLFDLRVRYICDGIVFRLGRKYKKSDAGQSRI